jgi:hypothetical protein
MQSGWGSQNNNVCVGVFQEGRQVFIGFGLGLGNGCIEGLGVNIADSNKLGTLGMLLDRIEVIGGYATTTH